MKKSRGSTLEKIRTILSIISLVLTIIGLLKKFMDWQDPEEA